MLAAAITCPWFQFSAGRSSGGSPRCSRHATIAELRHSHTYYTRWSVLTIASEQWRSYMMCHLGSDQATAWTVCGFRPRKRQVIYLFRDRFQFPKGASDLSHSRQAPIPESGKWLTSFETCSNSRKGQVTYLLSRQAPQFPKRASDLSLSRQAPQFPKGASDISFETGSQAQPSSHSIGGGRGKTPPLTASRRRHEADHCRQGSAKVNEWSYVFIPPIYLHVIGTPLILDQKYHIQIPWQTWFQASASKVTPALFWVITQPAAVIYYRRFGTTIFVFITDN